MAPNLTQYLNQSILISIPALFEDGACRPFKLMGVELNGLWLQSEELNGRLLSDEIPHVAKMAPVVFVPFAQIAGVMIPTAPPPKELLHHLQKAEDAEKHRGKPAEKHSKEHDAEDRPKRKNR